LDGSWLLTPDRLVVRSGEVTFALANQMAAAQALVVYPLGDAGACIERCLAGRADFSAIGGEELISGLAPGESAAITRRLTPGWWTAANFMVGHSDDGTAFVHRDRGQRFTFLAV